MEKIVIDTLRNRVHPKKINAVLTDDVSFGIVQRVFSAYFSNSRIKLIRCMSLLKDVTEEDGQETLIRDYHSKSNHRGINESLEHLKREYFFPNMKEKISRIINSCSTCLLNKYERNRAPIQFELTETPCKPLEIVHIDIYSVHKENFLTILDKFSKFGSVYLLTGRTTLNLIKSLKHYMSHHGIPKKIVTDNGAEFISILFKEFASLYNIQLHHTSQKNSTGNAPVERFHSTLTEIIRIIYHQNKNKSISEVIDEAVITYNNSIHATTKLTPFELISGHYNRSNPFIIQPNYNTRHDYLNEHTANYEELSKIVHQRSLEAKEKNINKLNTNRKTPIDFTKNDIVYEQDNRRNKLAPRFTKHRRQQQSYYPYK